LEWSRTEMWMMWSINCWFIWSYFSSSRSNSQKRRSNNTSLGLIKSQGTISSLRTGLEILAEEQSDRMQGKKAYLLEIHSCGGKNRSKSWPSSLHWLRRSRKRCRYAYYWINLNPKCHFLVLFQNFAF
jgi:hypothetical protein